MLRKISDSINHCVKCDDETRYLTWAFNHDLILEPICWRCFERADKHINVRPGWKRLARNNFYTTQPVYADGRQNQSRGNLRLVKTNGSENQTKERIPAKARFAGSKRAMARAA